MQNLSEYAPTIAPDLFKQPSDNRVGCVAYSTLNALRLSGVKVPDDFAQGLIQTSLDPQYVSHRGLTAEAVNARLKSIGYEVKSLLPFPADAASNAQSMVQWYLNMLKQRPVLISISSTLSKRNRDVAPSVELPKNISVLHLVVATLNGTKVNIIDPYAPDSPEIFDTGSGEESLRLASWLISPWSQFLVMGDGKGPSQQGVLDYGSQILNNSSIVGQRLPFAMPHTAPRVLVKV